MRALLQAAWVALWALALAVPDALAQVTDPVVARVLGAPIPASALDPASDAGSRARRLARILFDRAGRDFAERNGLLATEADIAEVRDYHARFLAHDRDQRARKLAEIEQRLASPRLGAGDREHLEAFRAVLQRLAADDAARARAGAAADEPDAATIARWVEHARLDAALFQRFGGAVGLAPHGPYAHGARHALLVEYQRDGRIELVDAALGRLMHAALARPPAAPVPSEPPPDFTPFWRRPIPASYMPE